MNLAVTEFLAPYSSEVRNLALKIRALVLEVMPNAVEQVDPPSKIIAYGVGLKMADIVCVIAPYRSHVNLMFPGAPSWRTRNGFSQARGNTRAM